MKSKTSDKENVIEYPTRLTAKWMLQHVPFHFWLWAASILLSVLGAGAIVGQTSFVQELIGKQRSITLSAENVSERIDKLTEGYNANVAQLLTAIVNEEAASAKTFYASEQTPHLDAAKRLRETLQATQEAYDKSLKTLREFKQNQSAP